MVKRVQMIGKTTAELAAYTPLVRELTIEETKTAINVGDGTLGGGKTTLMEDLTNLDVANLTAFTGIADLANDDLLIWDASASSFKNVPLEDMPKSWPHVDLGNVSTTQTVTEDDEVEHEMTLTADMIFVMNKPATGQGAAMLITVIQDGTGGWTPTWNDDTGTPVVPTFTNTEPTWSGRGAAAWDIIALQYLASGHFVASHVLGS